MDNHLSRITRQFRCGIWLPLQLVLCFRSTRHMSEQLACFYTDRLGITGSNQLIRFSCCIEIFANRNPILGWEQPTGFQRHTCWPEEKLHRSFRFSIEPQLLLVRCWRSLLSSRLRVNRLYLGKQFMLPASGVLREVREGLRAGVVKRWWASRGGELRGRRRLEG